MSNSKQAVLAERRSEERIAVSLEARITDAAGEAVDCQVVDISGCGCRIRFRTPPTLGPATRLIITKSGASTSARVVWTAGEFAGLFFPTESANGERLGFFAALWRRLLANRG